MTEPFGPDFNQIPGLLLAGNADRTAPIYADRSPVLSLLEAQRRSTKVAGQRTSSGQRFWSTPPRKIDDTDSDVMEVNLASTKRINFLRLDLAHFPHVMTAYYLVPGTTDDWREVKEPGGSSVSVNVFDSVPARLNSTTVQQANTHPQHYGAEHWLTHDIKTAPFYTQSLRFILKRSNGNGPVNLLGTPVAYSLGIKGLNFGYKVESLADVPATTESNTLTVSEPFAQTIDLLGSGINFRLRQNKAEHLSRDGIWKCETQPVNYAVVNLYLDVRKYSGFPTVIDRLYLDPLTSGPNVNIYYTSAISDPVEESDWTPITSDFKLRKGFYNFLPVKASVIKLEFTNLTPEPYDSHTVVARSVQLFSVETVASAQPALTETGDAGTRTMSALDPLMRYSDNIRSLPRLTNTSRGYTPTEVLYSTDPNAAARLRELSDVYNYTPWQSGLVVPKFRDIGQHVYQHIEMEHVQRVGFTVGLRSAEAFRVSYAADDDTEQYLELFHDDMHLAPGYDAQIAYDGGLEVRPRGVLPVVTESEIFYSNREVYGIQYATTQSPAVQLLPDDDFNDADPTVAWELYGDGLVLERSNAYSTDIGSTVKVRRNGAVEVPLPGQIDAGTYSGIHTVYSNYNNIEIAGLNYDDLGGSHVIQGGLYEAEGGIASKTFVTPTQSGRVYAAARVIAPRTLVAPLVLQIVEQSSGRVVAEAPASIPANQVVEWVVAYSPGESGFIANSYFDLEQRETWANYDGAQVWHQMEGHGTRSFGGLGARLIQRGQATYPFYVDTVSIYDPSILWEFSNDGGDHYHPVHDIRNDPNGVFIFPQDPEVLKPNTYDILAGVDEYGVDTDSIDTPNYATYEHATTWDQIEWPGRITPPPPQTDNRLRYRVTLFRQDATVSALSIRPWYTDIRSGVAHKGEIEAAGPNVVMQDWYQHIELDPRYRAWHHAVPEDWFFYYRQFLLLRHENYIPVVPSNFGLYITEAFVVTGEVLPTPFLYESIIFDPSDPGSFPNEAIIFPGGT